jgi:cobalamin biosynthesis protein CobT
MEEEKKVSEETKLNLQKANPYTKDRGEDDAETEAFAKGELAKFQREQKEKEAEAATEQKDTDASEETADNTDQKATPIAERPAKAEDRVFKKRYDDLKRHYDSTINKHKEELQSLRIRRIRGMEKRVP